MRVQAFDQLLTQIKARLEEKGPASVETLSSELDSPLINVTFALVMLSEGKEKAVKRVSADLWDLTWEYRRKKSRKD